MKRKRIQYQIKTHEGFKSVKGWQYIPGLAANRPVFKEGWNLTHIRSGVCLNKHPLRLLKEIEHLIDFLKEEDWTQELDAKRAAELMENYSRLTQP